MCVCSLARSLACPQACLPASLAGAHSILCHTDHRARLPQEVQDFVDKKREAEEAEEEARQARHAQLLRELCQSNGLATDGDHAKLEQRLVAALGPLEAIEREQRDTELLKELCEQHGLASGGDRIKLELRLVAGLGWDKERLYRTIESKRHPGILGKIKAMLDADDEQKEEKKKKKKGANTDAVALQAPKGIVGAPPPSAARAALYRPLPNSGQLHTMGTAAAEERRRQRKYSWVRKISHIGAGIKKVANLFDRSDSEVATSQGDEGAAGGSSSNGGGQLVVPQGPPAWSAAAALPPPHGAFHKALPNSLYLQQCASREAAERLAVLLREESARHSLLNRISRLWWSKDDKEARGVAATATDGGGGARAQDRSDDGGRLDGMLEGGLLVGGVQSLEGAQQSDWFAPKEHHMTPEEWRAQVLTIAKAQPPRGSATPILFHCTPRNCCGEGGEGANAAAAKLSLDDAELRGSMGVLLKRLGIAGLERRSGDAVSHEALAYFVVQLCADPLRCVDPDRSPGAEDHVLPFWHPLMLATTATV